MVAMTNDINMNGVIVCDGWKWLISLFLIKDGVVYIEERFKRYRS